MIQINNQKIMLKIKNLNLSKEKENNDINTTNNIPIKHNINNLFKK